MANSQESISNQSDISFAYRVFGTVRTAVNRFSRIPLFRAIPRGVWLSLSFLLLSISSLLLLAQVRSSPDPLWSVPFSLGSVSWWKTSIVIGAARQLPVFEGALYGVAIERGRVWVVGDRGFIAYTEDNGRCWNRLEYTTRFEPNGSNDNGGFREPALNSCGVSETGTAGILLPWVAITAHAAAPLSSKDPPPQAPADPKNPYAEQTRQDTNNTEKQQSSQPPTSTAGYPISPESGNNTVVGGVSNKPEWTPPPIAPNLRAILFLPDETGRIVADNGTIFEKAPDETQWRVIPQPSASGLRSVEGHSWRFDGSPNSWATETRETSQWWRPQPYTDLCETCQIYAYADDGQSAWAIAWATAADELRRNLFFTRDPDGRWWPASRSALPLDEQIALDEEDRQPGLMSLVPIRFAPPWYLVALVFSLVLSLPALARPEELAGPEDGGNGVEQVLVTDRPLEPADPDVLGLKTIALGLSRFLRNEKTLAPLTVAINGEWGTGKSSLMNLLRRDLESYGFRPVWFNAWHHQKEEHLLAAILQTIRMDALPPFWQWQGALFRLKLLAHRSRRSLPQLITLLAILVLISTLEFQLISRDGHGFISWTLELVRSILTPDNQPVENHGPLGRLPVFSSLIALAAVFRTLSKGLTGFGANPGALLWRITDGQKMKNLEEQSSFRQRFAAEFREVAAALNPRRPLVIFIDDLDRCTPGNVLQVLEAVNFLVSSGDCFVIIGMARRPVEGAVAFSLKDVAPNMGREPMDFARDYLDKLINIEVPVPKPDGPQAELLFGARKEVKADAPAGLWFAYPLLRCLQVAVPLLLMVLIIWGGMQAGKSLAVPLSGMMKRIDASRKVPASPDQSVTASAPTAETPGAAVGQNAGQPEVPPAATSPSEQSAIETLVRGGKLPLSSAWLALTPSYVMAILLVLVAQITLTTRPGVVTHDSHNFARALAIWHPLVLLRQGTPRTAKRFVNRIRFLAMRQGPGRTTLPGWEQALFPSRLSIGDHEQTDQIPESLLVVLAAIEQAEPAWIYDEKQFELLLSDVTEGRLKESLSGTLRLFLAAREQHLKEWGEEWLQLRKYRKQFLEMWPEIKAR